MNTIANPQQRIRVVTPSRLAQNGFTLIEMMIAMSIGLMIIASAATVFSSMRQSVDLNTALTDIQDDARFAIDTITRDLRMAGFQGCVDINTAAAKILADGAPTTNYFNTAVSSSLVLNSGEWSPVPPIGFTVPTTLAKPVVGTHTLSVQFGNPKTYTFAPLPAVDSDIILDSSNTGLVAGDLAIISNCQVADIFEITSSEGQTLQHTSDGNSDKRLSAPYGLAGANNRPRIMRFEGNIYFIGDTQRTNGSGDPVYSLYKQTLPYTAQRPPIEMIEGVANMKIRLGFRNSDDDNDHGITFVSPDQAGGQVGRIEVVQIGLLMQSYNDILQQDDETTYYLAGSPLTPALAPYDARISYNSDRRLKLAFNSTVKIRNRR